MGRDQQRKDKCERVIKYFSAEQALAAAQRFWEMGGDYLLVVPCGDHFHLELKETWKRRAA